MEEGSHASIASEIGNTGDRRSEWEFTIAVYSTSKPGQLYKEK